MLVKYLGLAAIVFAVVSGFANVLHSQLVALHLTILCLTACLIVYADHMGFSYMRGSVHALSVKKVAFLHWSVWMGLIGMISSGFYIAYNSFSFLITDPLFLLKMFFVLVLFVNAIFIGSLSRLATTMPYAALTARQKLILNVSAAASTISWIGAATIGLFFL